MKKILKKIMYFFTVIGFFTVIYGIGTLLLEVYKKQQYVSENSILVINLDKKYSEVSDESIIDEFLDQKHYNFLKLIQSIEFAATDDNIKGILAYINISALDMAQIQNVAQVIEKFRKTGKPAYIFSHGFGPFGQGNREYYLATFFDKIFMQPHSTLGLNGISIDIPFFKNVLQKIGVEAEFYTRYEYKTAMMSFTENNISSEYENEMLKLGNGIIDEFTEAIKKNRTISEDIKSIIDRAPLSSEEALALNLVDELTYLPQLKNRLKEENGVEHFISFDRYSAMLHSKGDEYPAIAFLHLGGIIAPGRSYNDIDGEYTLGSQDVLDDIKQIEKIKDLIAVVVRIDSPGGDYNASDEIYNALKYLKQKKNVPLIITQGGYAASGGYFISLAGDYIISEPLTITGSIGVYGGKFIFNDLWKKLDISWKNLKIGKNADILSANTSFTAEEQKIFNRFLDDTYNDFTTKVKENRQLRQPIDEIARGRVWTGKQALELGLVDELGGYDEAVFAALKQAGFSSNETYRIVNYPKEKNFGDKIRELLVFNDAKINEILKQSGVDIRYLNLFKRLQYDTVMLPLNIKM
ncbi:MAG: signal peptide peptidase SppA [Alphaproteobacteria bacterium]|nr:signal peptide peptidase SppA [Alphaproteobacteria bacterium]